MAILPCLHLVVSLAVALVTGSVIDRSVCYGRLGCFNTSYPYDNTSPVLPDPPERINTKFMMITESKWHSFTRPIRPFLLRTNSTRQLRRSLRQVGFNIKKPLKIIIHGFTQSAGAKWIEKLSKALITKEDTNILLVDWGDGAHFPHYLQAAANIRVVGEQLRQLLVKLISLGIRLRNVHIIGHSLGAHVANYAVKNLNGTVDHITGLDPAEPLFQGHNKDVRLDSSDADFVDVVHTNGKPFYQGGVGMSEPSGHADFFVNGGADQPGCPTQPLETTIEDLIQGDTAGASSAWTCSHSRAHDIYTESIINGDRCEFVAYPCNNTDGFNSGHCLHCADDKCQRLGYNVKIDRPRGKFFLKTRHEPPFCGHHNAIEIISHGNGTTKGQIYIKIVQPSVKSAQIPLFHSDTTLGLRPLRTVIVTYEPIYNLTGVMLTYHKYESWLPWMSGDGVWKPRKLVIRTAGIGHSAWYEVNTNNEDLRSGETKYMTARRIK